MATSTAARSIERGRLSGSRLAPGWARRVRVCGCARAGARCGHRVRAGSDARLRAHAPTRPRPDAGFTLIEIGLVLLIIAIAVTLVVPRFRDQSHAELISQTRKLATTFRFLQQEAILNGRVYRLNFDLDQQRYFVTSAEESGELGGGFAPETGILARDVALPASLQIADVDVPLVSGKLYEGVAFTHFYPDGYVDATVVHLDNGQEVYTLYVDQPLTGRAYVASGYLDLGTGR
jgi:general secretion pathway protein H